MPALLVPGEARSAHRSKVNANFIAADALATDLELQLTTHEATLLAQQAQLDAASSNVAVALSVLQPGMVEGFGMNTAPTGWLRANGAAVSRTAYAALFAAIGTLYGVGDGSTTFNLPDYRGEFLRGFDDGRGVDAGRVFGSAQAATATLQKTMAWSSYDTTISTASVAAGQAYAAADSEVSCIVANTPAGAKLAGGEAFPTGMEDNVILGAHSSTTDSTFLGKWITYRPRNKAVLYCIKY